MSKLTLFSLALYVALLAPSAYASCNQPAPQAITLVDVPGHPFMPVPTKDGCWVFVSIENPKNGPPSGVAVLRRDDGKVFLSRTIPTEGAPLGMVLTPDEKLLIGALDDRLVFLDTARMMSGESGAVLGYLREPEYHADLGGMKVSTPGAVYVSTTSDGSLLFESDEWAQRITVIDLEKARNSHFSADSIIGTIPTGGLPIGLVFSRDGRYLYSTAEAAASEWNWPIECVEEGQDPSKAKPAYPQGAVVVIDVARARTDPAHAVIAKVPAGCSAVRLAISPAGDRIYVTARNGDMLHAFDAKKLVHDPNRSALGKVLVGRSPVGVEVVDKGRKVVTANSNRLAKGDGKQNLTVVAAAKVRSGAAAVLGEIPAGSFPRELRLTADGRTLLVTNYNSNNLELVDVGRLRLRAQ